MSKHEDNAKVAASAIAARNMLRKHPLGTGEMTQFVLAHMPAPPVALMRRARDRMGILCSDIPENLRLLRRATENDIAAIDAWLKENE